MATNIEIINEVLDSLSSGEKTTTSKVAQEVIRRLAETGSCLNEDAIRIVVGGVAKSREDIFFTRGGHLRKG